MGTDIMTAQRAEYNRSYYLAHPELKERAKERERKKREKVSKVLKTKSCRKEMLTPLLAAIAYLILLLGITFLLLREMAAFYSESESSSLLGWIKAGVLECAVILFSFSIHKNLAHRLIYKSLAIGICILSIYGMCSKQLSLGLGSIESKQINSKAINDTERTIAEKSVQRDYFLSHGWITAARKTEAAIDALRLKLDKLRATAIELKPVQVVTHSTLVQVILRIFLMLANILAAHRLGELSRSLKGQFEIRRRSFEISKRSPETSGRNLKLSRREDQLQMQRSREVFDSGSDSFWKWFPLGEKSKGMKLILRS